MRILLWSETYWPRTGGVERLAAALVDALRHRGHDIAVVTWTDEEESNVIEHGGVRVFRFPFFKVQGRDRAGATLAQLSEVADLKRRFRPDIVHINSYGRSVWFHVATRRVHRAPEILSLHQPPPDEARRDDTLAAALLSEADRIVCCSNYVYDAVQSVSPGLSARLCVVRNALEPFSREPPRTPFDAASLVFVGRFVREKGLDWLLPQLPRLFERYPMARLDLIGDGPLRTEIEKLAEQLGISGFLRFLGPVSAESVARYLAAASVVIVPSRTEGFGLVALEAALLGRPVVATRVGGLAEVVLHEKTGLLSSPADAGAFVDAVASLLADPVLAHRLGDRARVRALNDFRWEDYLGAYEALYGELLRAPQAVGSAAASGLRCLD